MQSEMNARGLLLLCVLLFGLQIVFCNEFAQRKYPDDISGGDSFKFWQNSKQRRSVTSIVDGRYKTANEQTPQISPHFECDSRVIKVFLKQADVVNLRIHGPLGDLLHLSQLAAFCGVSIKTSRSDVHLQFSHDSCYVKQAETEYVLSLNWYGTEHVLSCPVSVTPPPSVACKKNSMEMTVGDGSTDELSVALNGEWAPLLYVATECWHQEQSKRGVLTFSVPFSSCGVNFRDGHVILDLKSKGKMMPLSCPYEPIPVFPVKDPGLSEKTQLLPQKQPNVYHKPPAVFPGQIVKQGQALAVEQQERNVHRSYPRARWLPKLPPLPGSFNLAVNFPFSIPIPNQPVPLRYPLTSLHVAPTRALTPDLTLDQTSDPTPASTPDPTPASTPDPTPASTPDPTPASTLDPTPASTPDPTPASTPASTLDSTPAPTPAPVYSSNQQLAPSVQNRRPHHKHMKQEPYPYRFQNPAPSESESSLDLKYPFSRVLVPSTSLYQPSGSAQNYNFPRPNPLQENPSLGNLEQYLPPGYFICSHNQQPQVFPEMFQPPVPNPAQPFQYQYQDPRPFHPGYYQMPSGSVQQPWSTSHLPVKGLSQESKPMMQASSRTPEYFKYQTGGDQSLDLYQRPIVQTSGRRISSNSQYQPSQLSTFQSRPEVLSADVSTENTRFSPRGFFQPRSIAPSPQAPKFTGNNPIISLPQPMPRFPVKKGAGVAQLPYRQGPLVRGMQNPHVHTEKPSEPRSQTPQ